MMDNPIKVTLELPAEIVKRFEERAQEEHRPLVDLLTERLVTTFDEDEEEDYEDSDEQILADLRESLQEAKRGEWLDFDEVMNEMKRKYNADNH